MNIGAIPLRPNLPATEDNLKDFVKKLVEGSANLDDVFNHVNPHKGAVVPVATPAAISDATIFGTYHGKPQMDWIEDQLLYNMPLEEAANQGITSGADAARKKVFVALPSRHSTGVRLKTFEIKEFVGKVSNTELQGKYKYYHPPTKPEYWLWRLKPARDATP